MERCYLWRLQKQSLLYLTFSCKRTTFCLLNVENQHILAQFEMFPYWDKNTLFSNSFVYLKYLDEWWILYSRQEFKPVKYSRCKISTRQRFRGEISTCEIIRHVLSSCIWLLNTYIRIKKFADFSLMQQFDTIFYLASFSDLLGIAYHIKIS